MKVKLSEISDVRTGFSFRDRLEPHPSGNVAVLQMKDFDERKRITPATMVRVLLPDIPQRHLVFQGDLVFQPRGNSLFASIVPELNFPTFLAAPMILIRCQRDKVDPQYLRWFLNGPSAMAVLSTFAAGTSVRILNKTTLEALEVPLPNLGRQRAIAELGLLAEEEEMLGLQLIRAKKSLVSTSLMEIAKNSSDFGDLK